MEIQEEERSRREKDSVRIVEMEGREGKEREGEREGGE